MAEWLRDEILYDRVDQTPVWNNCPNCSEPPIGLIPQGASNVARLPYLTAGRAAIELVKYRELLVDVPRG